MSDGGRGSGGASERGHRAAGEAHAPDTGHVDVALTKPSRQACTRFIRVLYVSSVHCTGAEWSGVMTEEQYEEQSSSDEVGHDEAEDEPAEDVWMTDSMGRGGGGGPSTSWMIWMVWGWRTKR